VRSVGPGRERSIRVLVAEAAAPPVPLSSLLESAGHRVVGRASTPEEVERLLRVTRPSVVVFDAEMSVEAVADARASYPRIGIVAVWPAGIESEKVDRVVAPAAAHAELARAVRDASPVTLRRHAVPAAPAVATAAPAAIPVQRGRGGVELGVAAVLTFLLVMAAVALRIGEGIPSLVTGAPPVDGPVVPAVTTGSPVPPPDGPSGSTDRPSEGFAEVRSMPSSTGGGAGTAPTGTHGGGSEPNPGHDGNDGNDGNEPIPPGGTTTTPRERDCRAAAGLPIEGQIGGPALEGELGHLFEHCLATRSPGPIRALEKFISGGGGGSGSDGDHGDDGDHGSGHDGDHGDHGDDDDDDGDHGSGHGDHDEDDDDDGDHGSGHDGDHDDDDDDHDGGQCDDDDDRGHDDDDEGDND